MLIVSSSDVAFPATEPSRLSASDCSASVIAGISSLKTWVASWFSTQRVSHRLFSLLRELSGHFSVMLLWSLSSLLLESLKKFVVACIQATAACRSDLGCLYQTQVKGVRHAV